MKALLTGWVIICTFFYSQFGEAQTISDLRFDSTKTLLDALFFEDTDNFSRSIVTCGTWDCFNTNDAQDWGPITIHYCDMNKFPEGCVRRWEDQSGHTSPRNSSFPNELLTGRDIGQDDLEKPGIVMDCINGHPCVRGGTDYRTPDGTDHPHLIQNSSFDMEYVDRFTIQGAFSALSLFRPVMQDTAIDGEAYIFAGGANGIFVDMNDSSLGLNMGGFFKTEKIADHIEMDEWLFLEVYGDDQGNIEAFVNGLKTSAPGLTIIQGALASGSVLSGGKGFKHFMGDMAMFGLYAKELSEPERQIARDYIKQTYNVPEVLGFDQPTDDKIKLQNITFQANRLNFSILTSKKTKIRLEIYDMLGAKVASEMFDSNGYGFTHLGLNLPSSAAGIYNYRISETNNVITGKVLVNSFYCCIFCKI